MRGDGVLAGGDVYIVASGGTLTHMDPGFFEGRRVIAVNRAAERNDLYALTDVVTVTHYIFEDLIPLAEAHPEHHFYAPVHDQGYKDGKQGPDLPNATYFEHRGTDWLFEPEPWGWPENGLIMGSTTLHAAMHLACRMGAENLMLVGADCGVLDGATNQQGYVSGNLKHESGVDSFLERWEHHLRAVKAVLTACYGVRIYSVSPFLNPNLEGHSWRSLTAVRA
jgi:hypothetical protein